MRHRPLGNATVLVLASIARGCKYGFDIMDDTGLQSGSVYRALSRLEELGLARSKWEAAHLAVREKRPRRRYYEMTESGKAELSTARETIAGLAKRLRTESH